MAEIRRPFTEIARRSLLKGLAGTACAVAAPGLLRSLPARAQFGNFPFSLGVASGDPSLDGIVIWTRVAPQPLAMDGGVGGNPVEVRWEIATDRGMQRILQSGTAQAVPASGHSVHVEIAGLEPGREYFYRFRAGEADSAIGRSRTLPAAVTTPSELRFAVAGCQRWEEGFFTAWQRIAEEEFDFVFHYGDYIYELPKRKGKTELPRSLPKDFGECITLSDYRRRYALYKTDTDLQAAHASCAFLPSFDDHEVAGNWSADVQTKARTKTPFLPRRAAAFQAWYENMPVRRSVLPRGPDIVAYRAFRFGNLADVAVLDTRQHRSRPVCLEEFDNCREAKAPGRTMLGPAQERWLADTFSASGGIWQVLAQQVLFAELNWRSFARHGGGEAELRMDSWDGAPAGRERVLNILRQARAANPVVLSGDLHRALALEISADPRNLAGPCAAVEFLASSISSGGDGRRSVKNVAAILRDNPHLKWLNAERGYTRHVVTAKRWQADYRVVAKVSKRGEAVATRKSFAVEAGRPGLLEA